LAQSMPFHASILIRFRVQCMPEKPTIEYVEGALAATVVYGSPVPSGKRRLVLATEITHDDPAAAGIYLEIGIDNGTDFGVIIKSSGDSWRYAALGAGFVPSGTNLPMNKPFLMSEFQRLNGYSSVVGAGRKLIMRTMFVEWYYDFEDPPWQLRFLLHQ